MGKKYEHKLIKIFSRPHTIQRISFIWPYIEAGLPQDNDIKVSGMLVFPAEGKYDYYMYEDEWMEVLGKINDRILSQDISKQEKDFQKVFEDYTYQAKRVKDQDLSKWSNQELVQWYKDYSHAFIFYTLYAFTPWAVDHILSIKVIEKLEALDAKKAAGWFEAISSPTRLNEMNEQQVKLLEIASGGDYSKINEHTEKYYWLPIYNLGDKPWTEEDFKKQIAEIDDPAAELKKKKDDLQQRIDNFNKALKEIEPDQELEQMIRTIQLYTYLRDVRVDEWRKVLYYIEGFYKEVAQRAGVDFYDIVSMFDEEIIDYLENGKLPDQLKKRKELHAIVHVNNEKKIFIDPAGIKQVKEKFLGKEVLSEVEQFKGMAAFKGRARGIVKVIKYKEDLAKFQEGQVLVAHHTTPDYIVAMKKAVAFVTDEGGITSHAAIVSRELKTPCITATGNASEVLKDGMEVEVDADNGIVKIL